MRLKNNQIQGLIAAFEEVFKSHHLPLSQCELCLYGSRTKDELKGGDIDLLLCVPQPILKSAKALKIEVSLVMKKRLGEQKIDLLIIADKNSNDPFHQIAVEQSLILKKW